MLPQKGYTLGLPLNLPLSRFFFFGAIISQQTMTMSTNPFYKSECEKSTVVECFDARLRVVAILSLALDPPFQLFMCVPWSSFQRPHCKKYPKPLQAKRADKLLDT